VKCKHGLVFAVKSAMEGDCNLAREARMKSSSLVMLLLLAACGAPPLASSLYKPADPWYRTDLPDHYFLKGKVGIGEVVNSHLDDDIVTPEGYAEALERMLKEAGMLAQHPAYILNADIVDYRWPSTGILHITGGAAVKYTLVDAKTHKQAWQDTVTSTQKEHRDFLGDPATAMIHSLGLALGENAAQAIRELSMVKSDELKGGEDSQ
jgi:hypothetical protein